MNLLYSQSAMTYCLRHLKRQGYKWHNVKPINEGRYWLVYGNPRASIIFKKDWFYKFGELIPGQKGIGDTVNSDDLKEMVKEKIETIYIVHKSGSIYSIPLSDFILKSQRWQNKEGKDVRSISLHEYKRLEA